MFKAPVRGPFLLGIAIYPKIRGIIENSENLRSLKISKVFYNKILDDILSQQGTRETPKSSETRALKELAMCRLFQKEPVPEKFDMVFGCKLERQFCWTVLAGLIPHHSS